MVYQQFRRWDEAGCFGDGQMHFAVFPILMLPKAAAVMAAAGSS